MDKRASSGRERLELLIRQADVPGEIVDGYFVDGHIDRVVCNESNNEWTIHVAKETLIPEKEFRVFSKCIQEKFAHIAKIRFVMHYASTVADEDIVQTYWQLFIDWISREMVSVNGWMTRATVRIDGGSLQVLMHDAHGIEMAQRRRIDEHIRRFYGSFFNRQYQVSFSLGDHGQQEYERFEQQRVAEEKQATQNMLRQVESAVVIPSSDEDKSPLSMGYEIRDTPVPISQIADEEKKVTIQGVILNLEKKELRNGNTLYQFILTDFTDSITVKVFCRNKDDLKALQRLSNDLWVRARGKVEYDRFLTVPELTLIPADLNEVIPPQERRDQAEEKRVEFHLHTNMSTMDGLTPVSDYIKMAAKWGHPAIAITDHGGVQSFPEAAKAAKKNKIKVIYGVEGNVINDGTAMITGNVGDRTIDDAEYIVFDIETTGLSVTHNKIIEIAAVKMRRGEELDRYSTFVDPHERIPFNITKLTNINDEMVRGAPEIEQVLPEFLAFIGDAVLVAHNANFDVGFMQEQCRRQQLPPITNAVLDTVEMARWLFPEMKNHRLNTLSAKLKVSLESHHRAIDDTLALAEVLKHMIQMAQQQKNVETLAQLNDDVGKNSKNMRPFHCCIYAQNQTGKKNLFKLISLSHTDYFHRVARIPRSKLVEHREGLLIASGCEKGELFETVLNKSREEAIEVARFYDVLEIQPMEHLQHLIEKGFVGSRQQLEHANRTICEIGKQLEIPVIATGNAHYLHPREKISRDITIHGITGFSPLKDQRKPDAHFRTTDEMLEEFAYLGEALAFEVVVTNTRALAERFESIEMFPSEPFFPIIEGSDDEIRQTSYNTAKRMYGDPLPQIVIDRLEKELQPIVKFGFSALYLIAERLVKKSNEDGYLVGSRGSVGSSVIAMVLGISEVNPLPPHYLCRSCQQSQWFTDGSVKSGFDLPDSVCPSCGGEFKGEGQDIPFETFLGFKGDKVPDIDLNFSGEYQARAHHYTKVLFGEKNVFRAGTIGTVADKTAFGYVKKYEEEHGHQWRTAEVLRLGKGCTGVKRSTGQHPGGIVVVPEYIDVEDITPVQFPADDVNSEWKTTHFDYHAFDENLLKLDILGHDDPTMMRMLYDLTGVDPLTIPMNDPKVMSVFNSTQALGVTPERIRTPVGTYGVPEMGTKFVRQMLEETKPSTFADLIQISGLSHGTGVWIGNAQELIRNQTCTIKTVIGCRDEIMLYLIYQGNMEAGLAFTITESVRKGRGLTDDWIKSMRDHGIPEWYINSCLKIEYMFPKAHATAYVMFAVRTVYYKLYHPIDFYAAYFSVRAEDFDVDLFCSGYDAINKKISEIDAKGFQALPKEKAMVSILEMGLEMTARGFTFKTIDLYRSDAEKFIVDGDALIPPFSAIPGVGINAARNIAASRDGGEYLSVEDFQKRSKATKSIVEVLTEMGCFRELPESNQLSLF